MMNVVWQHMCSSKAAVPRASSGCSLSLWRLLSCDQRDRTILSGHYQEPMALLFASLTLKASHGQVPGTSPIPCP